MTSYVPEREPSPEIIISEEHLNVIPFPGEGPRFPLWDPTTGTHLGSSESTDAPQEPKCHTGEDELIIAQNVKLQESQNAVEPRHKLETPPDGATTTLVPTPSPEATEPERAPSPEIILSEEHLNVIPFPGESPRFPLWEPTAGTHLGSSESTVAPQKPKCEFKEDEDKIDEEELTDSVIEAKKLEVEGVKKAETGNVDEAIEIFSRSIQSAPKRPSGYNKKAQAHRLKGNIPDQDIKLHVSQNPWKPLRKMETPPDEKDRLKRSVLSVLNKLTPQKFETLLGQVKGLNIDTEEKLALIVDLIFEKAINEPKFSVPYANFCKHLVLIKVPVSGSAKQVNFRKLLLTKCQKEFEQDRSDELKNEEKMKLLGAADPDKRKELHLEYEEEEKKIRYRQLGNIRFIGELFKLGMLVEPIMHECIKKLLSQGDEESLECLCKLLKTIGKELDDTKATKNSRDNQAAYYNPRNNVPPRTMQGMARNPMGTVVNQPGQQPSSQYGPLPTMVPLQPNFTSIPPAAMVNPQFSKMYQQRPQYPAQYSIMPGQQYLWNTYNTPPPQNANGYFQSHGMSSYQSLPPQMPPQPIPAQPQQRHGKKTAVPIIDPKTGKNVLSADKNADDSCSRPSSEKESESSDSNICVQFAAQVAAVLNDSRSDIASKQLEPVRIDTMCSHENEGMRIQETTAHIQKLTEVNRAPPPIVNNPMRAYDPFMPGYARAGPMPRMPHAPVNRRSQGRGGEKPRKVISFTSSLNQNIKLHESQNAWKPLHKSEIPPDEKAKLKRNVQSVLNKLTPQKFETLLSKLKALDIDTEEKLALVIDLIFEKAIDEPNFSVPYANLCKHLALNNWIPRRDENNPKTIDQIHKEAEREAREQQQVYQNMSSYPKRVSDDRDRRKNTGRMGPSEDGWTSSSKSSKGSYSMVDPSKLKLTKPDEVESIRLGPGGRGLQSWGRGSSGGTKTTAEAEKTALTNRFSALSEQSLSANYEGRRGSQRSAASSRESSRGRNSQLPPAIRKTPSTSKERENLLETVKGLARTSEAKAPEVKPTADVQVNGKATAIEELALNGPEYNEDDMEKKTKPLIDEFLHNNDFEEAIKCVTELASPVTIHMFINAAINQVLERSSQARYSLGQLLASLLKKKIITFDQYKKGFAGVLEIIDDYALDIPLIWDYMGEILEPLIEDIDSPFKLLKEVLQPCIPSEKAGMLVSSILHCAAKRKGTIKLGEVWRESGVQWTDIIGADKNVPEFIEKHKLEFTVSPTKVNPQTQMSMEEMKKHLLSLLEKNSELEEVFDWVDANVSDTSGPTFVRALVTAVHESCLSGSGTTWELNANKLKSRIPLISRYVSTNEKLQLQALYAVQALMNQLGQPSGLLHQIFDVLYDDDVISDESFKEWEQSDDPNEAEGKGVAVHSVKSFFTWLREPEEETEEMTV